ncbi:tetratricopeptide repeat protein [Filibacter tadaridae]|nr:tetratricopeptide repeat protein [Filibacter tadaridae]
MTSFDVKKNIAIVVPMQSDMSHTQLFHLYIIQGIIAYTENRFSNAVHIFTNAYELATKYRMEDWEMAELHYVSSLAASSDYRYILVIDHLQEALNYFNAKMLATRSIECLIILGNAQKHTRNLKNALMSFENAKEIMTTNGLANYLGMIEHNLGACYSLLKDNERALRHFNQSLLVKENPNDQIVTILSLVKEYKKTGDKESSKALVNKGIFLLNLLTEQNKNPYSHHFAIYKALLYDENDLISTFESALHYFEVKQNYYHCFVYCNVLADKLTDNNQFKLATTFYQKAFYYHLKHHNVQHWEELT